MFDVPTLMSARETAAVLALLARRALPWNRLAGAIEEEGSALALLESLGAVTADQLFPIEERELSLDELEDSVDGWRSEGIDLITVLDAAYPVNLRMVHDRPPV